MNLIGRMFLMSVTQGVSVPRAEFRDAWLQNDLPPKFVPKLRAPEDAFRRATPKKQWRAGLALLDYKGGQHLESGSSNEVVLVFSRDSKSRVDIHHLNRAVIYLKEGEIGVEPLGILTETEIAFLEGIKHDYLESLNNIDGSQCRNAIQKTMEGCACLTYRDGSYLMPREHFTTADAIVGMFNFMRAYTVKGQNVLWDIPYIDTETTRAQTRLALAEHIERTANAVIEEAEGLLPTHNRTGRSRSSTLTARLSNVGSTIDTYERILGLTMAAERSLLASALTELHRSLP